jgi:hypothetical protein
LTLADGREPTSLTARSRYAGAMATVLKTLADARRPALRRLEQAGTAKAQAAAARAVGAAYERAAREAGRVSLTALERGAHPDVVAALEGAATAWSALAAAAGKERATAYRRARSRARERESALRTALKALTALGYRLA